MILLAMIPGPVALDLPDGDGHEWGTGVRLDQWGGEWFLDWHGGHHHRNRITGPLRWEADRLHVPTDLGLLVLRPFDESDTWKVFPANVTAWEAHHQGLA